MIGKKTPQTLITAEEAVALSKYGTTNEIYIAKEIADEWAKNDRYEESKTYSFFCMLATIYEAGRIQGIREERKKKA